MRSGGMQIEALLIFNVAQAVAKLLTNFTHEPI